MSPALEMEVRRAAATDLDQEKGGALRRTRAEAVSTTRILTEEVKLLVPGISMRAASPPERHTPSHKLRERGGVTWPCGELVGLGTAA